MEPCHLLRPGVLEYQEALALQRRTAAGVASGADPTLILLQHPPTYTLGSRGETKHLLATRERLASRGATVVQSDRGGDVTFHGPGQIVGYPIINLRARGEGPVAFVRALEDVLIDALAAFDIQGTRWQGRPGVWVDGAKIAAIGVRISRGVTTHGFALNVSTDLSWFREIVPCGIADAGVTSMLDVSGVEPPIETVENGLARAFGERFGLEIVEQAEAVCA